MPPSGAPACIDLLVAAPSEPSGLPNWGDYHFGRAVIQALREQGVGARLVFRDGLETHRGRDGERTLLVLRGKFRPNSAWLHSSGYRQRILWVISWPLDLTPTELNDYDLILVASPQDRPRIAALSSRPTLTLLQATAFRSFAPPPAHDGRLLFIGNTRGQQRPIVQAFAEAQVPLALIGQGWQQWGLQPEATSIANALLPQRYRQALAVLNDHHGAMRDYGYMNNRIYDVLACAVPVITDQAPHCPPELLPGVILHRPGRDDPADTIEAAQGVRSQPELLMQVARTVRRHHSFTARVSTLLEYLESVRAGGLTSSGDPDVPMHARVG